MINHYEQINQTDQFKLHVLFLQYEERFYSTLNFKVTMCILKCLSLFTVLIYTYLTEM